MGVGCMIIFMGRKQEFFYSKPFFLGSSAMDNSSNPHV